MYNTPWNMNENILEIINLTVAYDDSEILSKLSISFLYGKSYALIGASGTGKSTLLKAIDSLLSETATINGDILFRGNKINAYNTIRGKEITFLLQDPKNQFNPVYTIGTQLNFSQYLQNPNIKRTLREERTKLALKEAGLDLGIYSLYPHQLSGGMLQRASLAIALLEKAPLVLLDEPTSGLDSNLEVMLLDNLLKMHSTLIYITHSLTAARKADYIVVLNNGKLVEQGKADDIINNPKEEYTKALIKASCYD